MELLSLIDSISNYIQRALLQLRTAFDFRIKPSDIGGLREPANPITACSASPRRNPDTSWLKSSDCVIVRRSPCIPKSVPSHQS